MRNNSLFSRYRGPIEFEEPVPRGRPGKSLPGHTLAGRGFLGEMIKDDRKPKRTVIRLLIFGLLTAGLCGCDQKLPSWYPFASHVVDDHGIATPTERITNLQELAKKAPETTDPGQRESICQELAQQIRKEPDSIIRGEILNTLAAYGGPTADAVLSVAVKDPDADVRVIVCDCGASGATPRR